MDKRLLAIPVILLFGLALLFSGLMGGFTDAPTDDPVEPEIPSVEEPEVVMQKADLKPSTESEPEVVVQDAPTSTPTPAGSFGGPAAAPMSSTEPEVPAPSTPAPATADEGAGDESTGDEGTATAADVKVVSAASVTPVQDCTIITGNAYEELAQVDDSCLNAAKLNDWDSPFNTSIWTYNVTLDAYQREVIADGNTIQITAYLDDSDELITFDWSSAAPIEVLMVKSGTCYLIYTYNGATGDTGLIAPDGKAVSHTTFGWACGGGGTGQEIPEFPTIALPMLAIIGMAFFFNRRK